MRRKSHCGTTGRSQADDIIYKEEITLKALGKYLLYPLNIYITLFPMTSYSKQTAYYRPFTEEKEMQKHRNDTEHIQMDG